MEYIFNYYDYINHYGNRMYAIAGVKVMPVSYSSILFTGSYDECMERLDPKGLEGSIEDIYHRVAFPK
jgi:hypothetical protein